MSEVRTQHMSEEASLAAALERRVAHAEKYLNETKLRPSQILYVSDLFASDDAKLLRQVSLRATKIVQSYCHVMFDLTDLLGGKEVKNVTRIRFKHTYDSKKQKDCIQEAISSRLAAVWLLGPVPPDLDKDLSTFGCWNIHRGPINKILAALTGVLRNRARRYGLYYQPETPATVVCGKRQYNVMNQIEDVKDIKNLTQEEDAALAILSLNGESTSQSGQATNQSGETSSNTTRIVYVKCAPDPPPVTDSLCKSCRNSLRVETVQEEENFRDAYHEMKERAEKLEYFIATKPGLLDEWKNFNF